MKKILAILALASISSMYAGPYEESFSQSSSSPRRYRTYQADDYKTGSSTQQMINNNSSNYETQAPSQSSYQGSVSDQNVIRSIDSAFKSDKYGTGFKDVKVKVSNGNVRLTGTVDLLEYKSKAESIVKRIDGVKQVDNQITVSQ